MTYFYYFVPLKAEKSEDQVNALLEHFEMHGILEAVKRRTSGFVSDGASGNDKLVRCLEAYNFLVTFLQLCLVKKKEHVCYDGVSRY